MDINELLNQIIFKYHLDRYYPHYRNMYEADRVLRKIIREVAENKSKVIMVGDDQTGISVIRNMSRDYQDIHFVHYRDEDSLEHLAVCWEDYERVFLISYHEAAYAERWFRTHHIKYEWIYDLFEQEGIYLQRVFYFLGNEDLHGLIIPNYKHVLHMRNGLTESIQCELYCQYSKYEYADNINTKRIALEKCLFLSIYMRNFKKAEEYVSLIRHNFQGCQYIDELWKEIVDLLNHIKERINERKEKDIILYWMDGIPYGDENQMPYLRDVMQNSVVFENAFTYIANTHPTMRAMMLGKKDIDDGCYCISKITRDNSPVIRYLEQLGYGIKIFSSYFDDENFPWEYLSEYKYISPYETISEKIWGMVSYILSSGAGKTFCIVHAMDAHEPCVHSMMNDDNWKIWSERYRMSRLEIDGQLAFYDAFMGKNAFRIYMSDHGRKQDTIYTEGKLRFHILFNIYHQSLQPRRINSLFSLLDFGIIIRQIIVERGIDEKEFEREYIEIGQLDWYSPLLIERICRDKTGLSIRCFGYKGIVDKEYIYVRYKFGKEWLHRRDALPKYNPQLFYDCEAEICDVSRLPQYRQLVSEYPSNIEEDEQFRYSKYLYKIYDNALKHNEMGKCIRLLNQILSKYACGSVGIRMGGIHSDVLWLCLTEENRKRIGVFIDINRECRCAKFHVPVVGKEYLNREFGIKAVLLSSFDHLDLLREEAKTYRSDIDILDVYKCFEENGIICKGNFWVSNILEGDYDVGFPFEKEN